MIDPATPRRSDTGAPAMAKSVIHVEISEPRLTGPVLERVVSSAAVCADLRLDELFDALSIVDAVVGAAARSLNGRSRSFMLETEPFGLRLSFTGLLDGEAVALVKAAHLPELGNVIERLARNVQIISDGDGSTTLAIDLI